VGRAYQSASSSAGLDRSSLFFSPADFGAQSGISNLQAGNYTVGTQVAFNRIVTVTGARFYWSGGVGAKTVKVSFWDNIAGGSAIQTTSISVDAAGIYAVTFPSAYQLPGNKILTPFDFGMYETTGSYYQRCFSPGPNQQFWLGVAPSSQWGRYGLLGPSAVWVHFEAFGAGDTENSSYEGNPGSPYNVEMYPLEPVYVAQ
jgi:hypothetical protein